jgi:hypothetical protein
LIDDHVHEWVVAVGGSNDILDGLSHMGRGYYLIRVARSAHAANYIKCVMLFDSRVKAEKWRAALLDPDVSNGAYGAVCSAGSFPESGFGNAQDYVQWREGHERRMEDLLEWYRTSESR